MPDIEEMEARHQAYLDELKRIKEAHFKGAEFCPGCGQTASSVAKNGHLTACTLTDDTKIVKCGNPECGRELTYEDCHKDCDGGGITHNCPCGHSMVTGTLGSYYALVPECDLCHR